MTYRRVCLRMLLALAVVLGVGLGYQSLFSSALYWPGAIVRAAAVTPTMACPVCNDNNADTLDYCLNGQCVNAPLDELSPSWVFNTNDSGQGSLRYAIEQSVPGATITFWNVSETGNGVVNFFDGTPHTITLTTGELVINKNLTIQGPGANVLTVSGNNASRVFNIASGATVMIEALTVANGMVNGNLNNDGGGIYNLGTLTLTHCAVSGNSVSGSNGSGNFGGGIFNLGTLTLTRCTVSGNSVSGGTNSINQGGGIFNNGGYFDNTVTIANSTLSGNFVSGSGSTNQGGGIFNNSGLPGTSTTLTITNSTLSNNFASGSDSNNQGSGIYNQGNFSGSTLAVAVINSTLHGNFASGGSSFNAGSGIFNNAGIAILTINFTNSTISGNSVSGGFINQGGGIYNVATSGSVTANAVNTIISGNAAATDPDLFGALNTNTNNLMGGNAMLGALANNGGPTQTMKPLPGSPAIDAGDNCVLTNTCGSPLSGGSLTTDQRGTGFPRLIGNRVDIGAVETEPTNTAPTITAFSVSRTQAAGASTSIIAQVSDAQDAATALSVEVNNAASATVTGVTVSNLTVDAAGNVRASVAAACAASSADFTLKVTDSGGLPVTTTLTVNVVNETTAPTINPISPVVVSLPLNSPTTSMVVNFPLPTATDNCTANPTVTTNPVSGSVFPVGTTSVSVTAIDGAGNQSTTSFTVTVNAGYNFTGFFSPVDNAPTVNRVNAGQAIPVKFSLGGNRGLNIFAAGYPASQQIACSGGAADDIEETVTAGGSSLSYDATTDRYNYVWKTDRAWKGTCRKLIIRFNDGTTREALFQFK